MSSDSDWKRYFLASGVPLEYEVARILASAGMAVNPDYEYLRKEAGLEKQFSVDISATWYAERAYKINYALDILVECKFRSREKYIAFFSDPNRAEFDRALTGYALSAIDNFVPYHLFRRPICVFEASFPIVYKGVEIHPKGAVEKDLRHASQQLKYAAPSQLLGNIEDSIGADPEDMFARFMSRILVTNAPLKVIRAGVGISEIEKSKSIEEISDPCDVVILLSGMGPEFRSHYLSVFDQKDRDELITLATNLTYSLQHQRKKFPYHGSEPGQFTSESFKMGYPANLMMQQIFVVTLSGLSAFVEQLKTTCLESYRGRRKSGSWR